MALAEPAHRRVARHRADLGAVEADQRHRRAHPRRGGRRLGAGMAAADHDDVEILRSRAAPLAHLFHVEHSLADAESPEQGVEHVLDPGPAGDSVEREPGAAQRLGGDQQIRVVSASSSAASASSMRRPVAAIERDLALGRQQRRLNAESAFESSASRPSPVIAETAMSAPSGGGAEIGLGMNQDRARSGAVVAAARARGRGRPLRATRGRASTPIASTASADSRRPAVSISRKGAPPSATGASIRSRVVPGTAVTIAASRPTNALSKARLAGIGRAGDDDPDAVLAAARPAAGPASAASSPRSAAEPRREIAGSGATSSSSEKSSAASTCGGEREQPRLPVRHLPAQRAAGQRQRGAALRLGLGLEQVGEPLGLGEVDAAVLEGAAGELAGLGGAQALHPAERREHAGDDRAAAMEMQLGDILAGRALRAREAR